MKNAELDHSGGLRMPRSRGAVSGLLLICLGAWGALIPFVGPHFDFAYTPDQVWAWTSARGWLEVLPGATAVVGGLLVTFSGNRLSAMLGGWLAVLAGAWFILGEEVAPILRIGSPGDPVAATDRKRAVLEISYFSGLGALIVFVGAVVLALTTVRLARDVPPVAAAAAAQPEAPMPAYEPYAAPYAQPAAEEVSPDATTRARHEGDRKSARGWRRQRAGTGA
ncbi:hypothetical protein [Mycobacterium servetii]|uniref:Secreted protein n=1 Tax=Mycobacterium servetii TaxID=3237418 RepID=A0ABV4C3R0_9MYCO